jgi:hypothetical protein
MGKYDNKDFTGHDLSDRKDMDNLTITGLCLSNETPNAFVLPPNLKGVTFVDCNLDNVFIPVGNVMVRGSNRRFKVQEDGEDWIIDAVKKTPLEPIDKERFIEEGKNIDPDKIEVEDGIS